MPRPTQPSISSESVNEDQLWLGRQAKADVVMPFVDKRVGLEVKLCDPLTTRALPEYFYDEFAS